MSLLCILPDHVVISLLVSWTEVRDIIQLDSAICRKSDRAYVLSLISDTKFVLQRVYEKERNPCGLTRWIMLRQIATVEMMFSSAVMNCPDRLTYLRRHGNHVRSVKIRIGPYCSLSHDELFRDLSDNCPNVTFVSSEIPVSAAAQAQIADHWNQLTHLTIETSDVGEELTSIGASCQSLVEVTLTVIARASLLVSFFQLCSPKLQKITVKNGLLEPEHRMLSCALSAAPGA
jgi:hypothetical protein